jgi:hypothetical protein
MKCEHCSNILALKENGLYYCSCGAVYGRYFAPNEIWIMLGFNEKGEKHE